MEGYWKNIVEKYSILFRKLSINKPHQKSMKTSKMHQKLVLDTFEETKNDVIRKTGITPSDARISELLSDYLSENKIPFSSKSLRILYSSAIKNNPTEIKQPKIVDALCKYLNYENFVDYCTQNINTSVDNKSPTKIDGGFFKKNKFTVIAISIILFILLIGSSINQQRWMEWNNDHYIEVNFDLKKYDAGELKIYNERRIKYFKKIEANCEVEFFDKSGKVTIWYGKNLQGQLEIFTSLGLHPETGKTLKSITKYMIKKYFCQSYN